jgi:hypothetical protein
MVGALVQDILRAAVGATPTCAEYEIVCGLKESPS